MSVFVGIDVSPRKLGWGLVSALDGSAVACGIETLDGSPESVQDAVEVMELRCELATPDLIYVEYPAFSGGIKAAFAAGDVFGMTRAYLRDLWSGTAIVPVDPSSWRSSVGIGSGPRETLKRAAVELAVKHGFDPPELSDDAAEAGLIAWAAFLDHTLGRIPERAYTA